MTPPPPRIRHPAIDRIPVFRRGFAAPAPGRVPRWARALLLLLPLLLMLAVATDLFHQSRIPTSLTTSTLTGTRLVTGPICLEEAVDVSGSLTAFAGQRNQAEDEMFAFARRELHKNDLFSEAFFAATAKLALAPTPLAKVSTPPAEPPGISPDATYLTPAVRALIAGRPAREHCASRALVMITDGYIDDPGPLATALRAGGYTRVFAVIPAATGWGRPSQLSGGIRNAITVYHFTSPGLNGRLAAFFAGAQPLDVVFGDIISTLTGQTLSKT